VKRRSFVAGSLALGAAGACKGAPPAELPRFTAEALLARAKKNGEAGRLTAFHFWATWCGPCIDEFPLIEQEWRGWIRDEKGLDFLGVSVDEPSLSTIKKSGFDAAVLERDGSVRKFIAQQKTTFPMSIAVAEDPDAFAEAIDSGWPAVLPTTLLFGLDGELAHRNIGTLRASRFHDVVSDLLAGKSRSRSSP